MKSLKKGVVLRRQGSSQKDNQNKREQGSLQIWTRSKTISPEREMITFSNTIINDES